MHSLILQDVISNGRVNVKFLNTTSVVVPITTYSSVPKPNAIASDDYLYTKTKTPNVLVHYNADPIDGSTQRTYIPPISSTAAPPITTYKPVFSTTSALPLFDSYATTTTPSPDIEISSPISVPSKYFLPPSITSDGPVVAINSYSTLPTKVAAFTIEQINNELEAPSIRSNVPIASFIPSTTTESAIAIGNQNNFNANARPIFDRNTFYRRKPISYDTYYQTNQLDYSPKHYSRYSSQSPSGFSYFLPRQYHEESYRDPQHRDGSFGYIDPFGIRRVVYYQASPENGFKIRKNNRYVGFNANPYDSK